MASRDTATGATVGATTTLFVERRREHCMVITSAEATIWGLLCTEETGSPGYSSTTPRDVAAAFFVLRAGADLNPGAEFCCIRWTPI